MPMLALPRVDLDTVLVAFVHGPRGASPPSSGDRPVVDGFDEIRANGGREHSSWAPATGPRR